MRVHPERQLHREPHVLVAHAARLGRILQDAVLLHVLVEPDAAVALAPVGRLREPVVREAVVQQFRQFAFESLELIRIETWTGRIRSLDQLRQEQNSRRYLILHGRRLSVNFESKK